MRIHEEYREIAFSLSLSLSLSRETGKLAIIVSTAPFYMYAIFGHDGQLHSCMQYMKWFIAVTISCSLPTVLLLPPVLLCVLFGHEAFCVHSLQGGFFNLQCISYVTHDGPCSNQDRPQCLRTRDIDNVYQGVIDPNFLYTSACCFVIANISITIFAVVC